MPNMTPINLAPSTINKPALIWDKLSQVLSEQTMRVKKQVDIRSVSGAPAATPDKPSYSILRLGDVTRYTGLGRSSIYKMMDEGRFPHSFKLGAHSVGWRETDIAQWVADRAYDVGGTQKK